MRAVVVDDEEPAREELVWLLEQAGGEVEVVAQASSARAALDVLEAHAEQGVDLIFLDVDMPGVDGVRLAELIRDRDEEPPMVIFVTAYEDYAVDAFDVDAVDYLLKPIRTERLQRALGRARQRRDERRSRMAPRPQSTTPRALERISVEERGVYRVIAVEEILFFEAEDGIVVIQTREARHITDFSLKFLEQNLDGERFFRSHRSYIVQLDAIESIAPWGAGTYRLILDRGADLSVPLARSRASELKALIPWSANVFED